MGYSRMGERGGETFDPRSLRRARFLHVRRAGGELRGPAAGLQEKQCCREALEQMTLSMWHEMAPFRRQYNEIVL